MFLEKYLTNLRENKIKLPDNVKGVFDKSGCREGLDFCGLSIFGLNSFEEQNVDIVVVTIVNSQKKRFSEILEYIKNKKIDRKIQFKLV